MRVKEARDLTVEELNAKLNSLKDELFNLRFQLATGQLENPMRIRDIRRSIARVQTVLKERQLKAEA
ncbi:MAG: 50S ribosomal protein L29 [Actinobacteria bacterium]|nr:50S ribosomal protein L29 [Actinomycetota bacterium]